MVFWMARMQKTSCLRKKVEAKKVTKNCAKLTSEFVQVKSFMKDILRRTCDAGAPRNSAGGGGGFGGDGPAPKKARGCPRKVGITANIDETRLTTMLPTGCYMYKDRWDQSWRLSS